MNGVVARGFLYKSSRSPVFFVHRVHASSGTSKDQQWIPQQEPFFGIRVAFIELQICVNWLGQFFFFFFFRMKEIQESQDIRPSSVYFSCVRAHATCSLQMRMPSSFCSTPVTFINHSDSCCGDSSHPAFQFASLFENVLYLLHKRFLFIDPNKSRNSDQWTNPNLCPSACGLQIFCFVFLSSLKKQMNKWICTWAHKIPIFGKSVLFCILCLPANLFLSTDNRWLLFWSCGYEYRPFAL